MILGSAILTWVVIGSVAAGLIIVTDILSDE